MLRVNRGLMWLQREEFDEAAADLTAAVALNDRQYQACAALAQVSQRQGRPDEAVERFGRAIALRPDWSPLYRGRADVTLARKDATPAQRAAALRDLDEAVRLESPGDPVLARDHTNRGRLLPPRRPRRRGAGRLRRRPGGRPRLRRGAPAAGRGPARPAAVRRGDRLVRRRPGAGQAVGGAVRAARPGPRRPRDFAGVDRGLHPGPGPAPRLAPLLARRGWAYLVADAPALALRDFEEAIRLDPVRRRRLQRPRHVPGPPGPAPRGGGRRRGGAAPGGPSARVVYNAARVYAQAAAVASSEVERKGRDAVRLTSRYQDRAVALVAGVLARRPPPAAPRSGTTRSWPTPRSADPAPPETDPPTGADAPASKPGS